MESWLKIRVKKKKHVSNQLQSFSHQQITLRRSWWRHISADTRLITSLFCYFVLKQIKRENGFIPRNLDISQVTMLQQTTGRQFTSRINNNNKKASPQVLQFLSHQCKSMFVNFIGCIFFVSFGRFLPLSLVGAQNWPACQDSFFLRHVSGWWLQIFFSCPPLFFGTYSQVA